MWRLGPDGKMEFYHPHEMTNLVDSAQGNTPTKLRQRLSRWMTITNDFLLNQA